MAFNLLAPEDYNANPYSWETSRSYAKVSQLDALGASAGDAWYYSPFDSIKRQAEMTTAISGPLVDPFSSIEDIRPGPTSKRLTETDWRESVDFRKELNYFDGMTVDAARLLAQRFDARREREWKIAHAPDGFWNTTGQIGTSFVVSALDPINLATAFIPGVNVLAQAVRGKAVANAARRFLVAGGEGAALTAAVEPIVYNAAQQDQADYTMADSLLAVAFGGSLAGTFGVAAGAVGDFVRNRRLLRDQEPEIPLTGSSVPSAGPVEPARARLSESITLTPEAHLDALRVAISQLETGRAVDVMPVLLNEARNKARYPDLPINPVRVYHNGTEAKFDTKAKANRFVKSQIKDGVAPNEKAINVVPNEDGTFGLELKSRGFFEQDTNGIQTFRNQKTAKKAMAAIEDDNKRLLEVKKANGKGTEYVIARDFSDSAFKNIEQDVSVNNKSATDLRNSDQLDSVFKQRNENTNQIGDITQPEEKVFRSRLQRMIENNQRTALPPKQIDEVEQTVFREGEDNTSAMEKELADLESDLDLQIKQGMVPENVKAELKEIDDEIARLGQMDEAIKIGLNCLVR